MAKAIAKISGIALAPGVSRNNRLYSREAIAKAVARAQDRIASGKRPIAMYSHHETRNTADIVGGVTRMWQDEDGNACYEGVIADTPVGRHIAALAAPAGPDDPPPILRGLSFRGDWVGPSRQVTLERGARAETAADLEIQRLDWTSEPGVDTAGVDSFALVGSGGESAGGYGICESAPDARVTITEETMPVTVTETGAITEGDAAARLAALRDTFGLVEHVLQDGFCVTCSPVGEAAQPMGKRTAGLSGPGGPYADPGYQADKKPRYQLDTKAHAKAAYSYFSMPKNAKAYTAAQVKRIKGRIMAALKKFGVKVSASESWLVDSFAIGEDAVAEHYADDGERASFNVSLNNGMVCVTVSSYCVPAEDLDIIATAAMSGACSALSAMDPDMDGDIDVEGVSSASDPDHDAGESTEDPGLTETADPAPDPAAVSTESKEPVMAATAAQEAGQALAEAQIPVSAGDPGPTGVTTSTNNLNDNDTSRNAEDDVAGNSFEAFLQKMIEAVASQAAADGKMNPAYAQLAAKLAASQALGMSGPQGAASVALRGAGSVPAPPVSAESAPKEGTVAETEAQMIERIVAERLGTAKPAIEETAEQRISRLVEERVAAEKARLTESGQGPSRKGLVTGPGVQESAPVGDYSEIPEGWPQKPLSEYSATEWKTYVEPHVAQSVFGNRGSVQPA